MLEQIVELKAKLTSACTTSVAEPMSIEPTQRTTHTNVDNLSATRQSISIFEEPTTLLTRSDIEALIRQEKNSTATMNWKPPYPATKSQNYTILNIRYRNSRNMIAKAATPRNTSCASSNPWVDIPIMKIFGSKNSTKSLTDQAYTWYATLKPGAIRD